MKLLDKLAIQAFKEYASRMGSTAKWNFLSDERQQVWKLEVLNKLKFIINYLESHVAEKPNMIVLTSFEKGYLEGKLNEQHRITCVLKRLEQQIASELGVKDEKDSHN